MVEAVRNIYMAILVLSDYAIQMVIQKLSEKIALYY